MPARDPRVDAYIARSAAFARPILRRLRAVVHEACPQAEETLKWSMPAFLYKGMLCSMAAFQHHCVFGFWKGSLVLDRDGHRMDEAMGQFGRITRLSDLPARRILIGYVHKAAKLNDEGIRPVRSKSPRKALRVPTDLKAALLRSKRALAAFEAMSPSHRREYVEWVTEAKREETRRRRLAAAIEWMAEGKTRNWKYTKC
jgi:uncharacterized protein YdeI (YjbR/CyaY-like superfamily)